MIVAMAIRFYIVFFLLFVTEACADIYRYVSEDGVECFTDSPSHKDSVLIMREPASSRKSSTRKAVTSKHQVPGDMKMHVKARRQAVASTCHLTGNLPVDGRITSLVGMRNDPIDGVLRPHNGIDIAIPEGTPVKPVAAGTIVYSGNRSGYGNMIIMEHQDGMRTVYAHNSVNLATSGEQVDRDTTIALSGSTGHSTGPHLHFEAWKAGLNITSDFLAYDSGKQLPSTFHEASHKRSPVRTAILPDGSLLFTNLPYIHP
jgi:murein DD-endopeptidase MepM/ murein hydrolase activator NlpD